MRGKRVECVETGFILPSALPEKLAFHFGYGHSLRLPRQVTRAIAARIFTGGRRCPHHFRAARANYGCDSSLLVASQISCYDCFLNLVRLLVGKRSATPNGLRLSELVRAFVAGTLSLLRGPGMLCRQLLIFKQRLQSLAVSLTSFLAGPDDRGKLLARLQST